MRIGRDPAAVLQLRATGTTTRGRVFAVVTKPGPSGAKEHVLLAASDAHPALQPRMTRGVPLATDPRPSLRRTGIEANIITAPHVPGVALIEPTMANRRWDGVRAA